jgi:hypothetical protein
LILKSYCSNLIFLPKQFLIKIRNKDENNIITLNNDINFIKTIKYSDFVKWFVDQLKQDNIYMKKETIYSYIITLNTERKINQLKPIYPWKNEILNIFWKNIENFISSEEIITKKNKIILQLEKKINELERTMTEFKKK